jgi:hypothetical protein
MKLALILVLSLFSFNLVASQRYVVAEVFTMDPEC